MEKYGVEEQRRDKAARDDEGKEKCPDCGTPLEDTRETGVAKCPKHGTKPFEK